MKTTRPFFIPFGSSAVPTIDYLLSILQDARAVTLRMVETVSQEELHWQYHEGWNSISCLLAHMVSCRHFLESILLVGES